MKTFYNTGLDLVIEKLEINSPVPLSANSKLEEKVVMEILNGLNDKIFSLNESGFSNYSLTMQNLLTSQNNQNKRNQYPTLNGSEILNENQIKMSESFIEKLLQTEDPNDAKIIANSFESEIINSSLNYGEKISLLSLSTGTIVVSEFIINGGIGKIRDKINIDSPDENQVAGCSINMRNVWGDAVVGFAGGAVAGCYAGATAGTVAFPLVGTVTGCVSAGMVSGAGGFITGASYSIVSGLLLSCFR